MVDYYREEVMDLLVSVHGPWRFMSLVIDPVVLECFVITIIIEIVLNFVILLLVFYIENLVSLGSI